MWTGEWVYVMSECQQRLIVSPYPVNTPYSQTLPYTILAYQSPYQHHTQHHTHHIHIPGQDKQILHELLGGHGGGYVVVRVHRTQLVVQRVADDRGGEMVEGAEVRHLAARVLFLRIHIHI